MAGEDWPEPAVAQAQGQAWEVNKDKLNWIYCTWTNLPHAGVNMVIKVITMTMRTLGSLRRGSIRSYFF